MSNLKYPRQSPTTYTEQLGDEVAVYDRARAEVHALNPTAAYVWRRCDGATSPDAIAAALRRELGIPEAEAVVGLTLEQFALVHLLELPIGPRGEGAAPTRRWLLGRGLTAAMLPAVYSIVAPAPAAAQSVPAPAAPTLTGLSPNSGPAGTTVGVTLTGTNFVVGGTTVTVNSGGVTATNVVVEQHDVADRRHRHRCGRGARCPHGDRHDGRRDERRASLHGQSAAGFTDVQLYGQSGDLHCTRRRRERHDSGRRRGGRQRWDGRISTRVPWAVGPRRPCP